jgi:hypothetical protein
VTVFVNPRTALHPGTFADLRVRENVRINAGVRDGRHVVRQVLFRPRHR